MSKVFNMVGGGGKNISSIIVTGLDSTDTVTCTKDGKSYTATWDETAQSWGIVGLPLGTFTVTATDGNKTRTETVLIDITGVYAIEMILKLWLYRYGDPCEDVTGGWKKQGLGLNSTYNKPVAPTLTLNDNNMVVSRTTITQTYDCGIVLPSNRIDFTDYSTIKIKWKGSGFGGGTLTYFLYRETLGAYVSDGTEMAGHNTDFTELVESYDISNVTGLQTVYISLYVRGTVTISEIWLE